MSYLDIHAHFAEEGYSFPEEWEKIRAAGVQTVVLAGDTLPHSRMHRDFAIGHDGAYFCAGIHPSNAEEWTEHSADELLELCKDEKCVAVGEIGLDYHYPEPARELQIEIFERQIELAYRAGLPIQIHARDCAADVLAVLHRMNAYMPHGFLLHCYSYGKELMDEFLSLGAYFSFGGVVCFKNARRAVECAAYCPKERILTETDSPYLSPFRGEKNTPANIPVILKKIAEVRGEREEALAEQIQKNARALFHKIK